MCFVSSLHGQVWGHQADTLMILTMNTTQANGGASLGHNRGQLDHVSLLLLVQHCTKRMEGICSCGMGRDGLKEKEH